MHSVKSRRAVPVVGQGNPRRQQKTVLLAHPRRSDRQPPEIAAAARRRRFRVRLTTIGFIQVSLNMELGKPGTAVFGVTN